jgi:hypothetical protein
LETLHPLQQAHYVIQHGHGYLCSRCIAEAGYLTLRSDGSFYQGPRRFRLVDPPEARIIGKSRACFARLPLPPRGASFFSPHGAAASLARPARHATLWEMFRDARLRVGLTHSEIDENAERIRSIVGDGITGKHARLLESRHVVPHTRTGLVLTPIYSLRYQDVLRVCHLAPEDAGRWSLTTRLGLKRLPDLESTYLPAVLPQPSALWHSFFGHWRDLPILFRQIRTRLCGRKYDLFYLNQSRTYRGLDPFLPAGSILAIERRPLKKSPRQYAMDWERPIYLLRVNDEWICSYIDIDDNSLTLVPHSAASIEPKTFRLAEVAIHGLVIGALLPCG